MEIFQSTAKSTYILYFHTRKTTLKDAYKSKTIFKICLVEQQTVMHCAFTRYYGMQAFYIGVNMFTVM